MPIAARQAAPEQALPDEQVELLRGSVQAGMVAQFVIAIAAAVGLIYLLKLVWITMLVAALLAFALDPFVVVLARLRIPRAVGAAIALLLLLGLSLALTFFFYNRAVDFIDELPNFSATIRDDLQKLQPRRTNSRTAHGLCCQRTREESPSPCRCSRPQV